MARTRILEMAGVHLMLSYQAVHHKATSEAQLLEHYVAAATAAGLDPIVDDEMIQLANATRLRWHQDAYSNWHVKGDAPEDDRSPQWLQTMASLASAVAQRPGTERIQLSRDAGSNIAPKPPLAKNCHLVLTTIAAVSDDYEDPDAFWSAWDEIEPHADRMICKRGFEAVDEAAWLRRTADDSLAMARAARPGRTAFYRAHADLEPWLASTSLAPLRYLLATRTLELAFTGAHEHITIRDLQDIQSRTDEQGRPVARFVVEFADEATARREARPLLDNNVHVRFPGGELSDVSPRPGPIARCELHEWGEVLCLRAGSGELRLLTSNEERAGELRVLSRSHALGFLEDLARQLGVSVSLPPGKISFRSWLPAQPSRSDVHPDFGRMDRYDVSFELFDDAGFTMWRYRDDSHAILDGFEPSADAVVRKLAEKLSSSAADSPPPLVQRAKWLQGVNHAVWNRDGSLWGATEGPRSILMRWAADATDSVDVAEIAGRVVELHASPDGTHIAVVACRDAGLDGAFSSGDPHDIWVVPATGGTPRKLVDIAEQPFGVAWSPGSDELAIGGFCDAPRLRIVDLNGAVRDEPKVSHLASLWVKGWTAEGVVVSVDGDSRERMMLYKPRVGFFARRWRTLPRVWWPSPCGRTEVSTDGTTLFVRGAVFGSWNAADPKWLESIASTPPTWCGPYRIVGPNHEMLDLRTWTFQPITDETREAFSLCATDDGTGVVWNEWGYVFRGWTGTGDTRVSSQ